MHGSNMLYNIGTYIRYETSQAKKEKIIENVVTRYTQEVIFPLTLPYFTQWVEIISKGVF